MSDEPDADATVAWRPDDDDDDDGRLLDGRYRLGERLGSGAVAEVIRGFDERLARSVAVKLFRGDAAEQLHRHEAEMRTLARLDHPNLVTVYDAGQTEDTNQPYLVMQLVDGHTLADEMRDGPLPKQRVAQYAAEIADALDYVHSRGFVHRDIKPANVLVSSDDGRVHLADFGIARLVDSAHVTKTGDVVGTPAFFAPEQVNGGDVGPATDVYALGLVVLECLTGQRGYEGTAMEVAMARLSRDPEIPASLPVTWVGVIRAMTAREPVDRPSASDVARTMRELASDGSGAGVTETLAMTSVRTPVRAAAVRRRRKTPWIVAGVVVALIAAAGAGVAIARNQSGSTQPPIPASNHQPRLTPANVEQDMEKLEQLVRPNP